MPDSKTYNLGYHRRTTVGLVERKMEKYDCNGNVKLPAAKILNRRMSCSEEESKSITTKLSASDANLFRRLNTEPFVDPTKVVPNFDLSSTMFVDVIVNNSVSPVNFSVQNYRQSKNLEMLESDMTRYYSRLNNKELAFKNIVLGGYYAVKYSKTDDNAKPKSKNKGTTIISKEKWVRCQIMKPFNENMPILTYLVDHGHYYPSEPKFLKLLKYSFHRMPIQSLEAKLHFLDATKTQFSPEDCRKFHERVEGKHFCGIIIPQELASSSPNVKAKGKTMSNDDKLSIILVDTKGEKDEYLHQDYLFKSK